MMMLPARARRRRQPLKLAAFVLLLVVPVSATAQHTQALITDLSGAVEVVRAMSDTTVAAYWGMQLFDGDEVRTPDAASVSMLLSNNSLVSLGANSSLVVARGPASATAAATRSVAVDVETIEDLTLRRDGDDLVALGGLRSGAADGPLKAISPRHTRVKTLRPTFAWHAAQPFEVYRVKLFSSAGVVWRAEVTTTSMTYPTNAPALEPGSRYFWQVEGDDLFDPATSAAVPFEVLPADRVADIAAREAEIRALVDGQTDTPSYHYLLGAYYAKAGLLDAATASFQHLAAQHPEAPLVRQILGTLRADVGLQPSAPLLAAELAQ